MHFGVCDIMGSPGQGCVRLDAASAAAIKKQHKAPKGSGRACTGVRLNRRNFQKTGVTIIK